MKRIHVAAAVIYNTTKEQILLAKRPDDKHQGGKWEFPGGKVEPRESVQDALVRELAEEIGIHVTQAQPLIQIQHDYSDKAVLLDIWQVTAFTGTAQGVEGQAIKWVSKTTLNDYQFPAANLPVLQAIALPDRCLITPDPTTTANFLSIYEQQLKNGVSLVQFRAKSLDKDSYCQLAQQVIDKAHHYHANVILNSPPTSMLLEKADGLHLTSPQLMAMQQRPILHQGQTLSASCHSITELEQAARLQMDFVMLSPVQKTTSHPEATIIGWERFYAATQAINCPVYALGGVGRNDIAKAKRHGAQGIAAISQLWC
jgi:8-oxo-dGTP diphosphatase